MQLTMADAAALLNVQHVDLEIMRAHKQLDELPQRAVILAARQKKQAILAKQEKVDKMHVESNRALTRLTDEDSQLADKQKRVQETIDASRGDYRSVEAHTKELNGFAKRRTVLEGELDALGDELAKIEAVQGQIARALAEVERQESEATLAFQKAGGALKQEIADLEAQRAPLAAELSAELAQQYAKTAVRCGGVAVGRLLEGRCGVCRAAIEGGRLLDMKAHAPLATCPHCGRMLIVD